MVRHFSNLTQVAHSGGKTEDGQLYTNSKEALNRNYKLGFRYFEIDFVDLKDGTVISAHDGSESAYGIHGKKFKDTNLNEVRSFKELLNFYTLDDLIGNEMVQKKDLSIVFDVKVNHIYDKIHELATKHGVLDRCIPQVYNEKTIEYVRDKFPYWLMTLWGIGGRLEQEKIEFCKKYKPLVVWMWSHWCTPEFEKQIRNAGVKHIGVHGKMDDEACKKFLARGIHVMNDDQYIELS